MKKLLALCGAVALMLAMTAPAAANEKVYIPEHSDSWTFEVPVSFGEGWDFQCTGPVYYGGRGSYDLWLWYKNGLTEAQKKPEGRAWPWIKGRGVAKGLDYFSSKPGMRGKVISGKFKTIDHQYRHYLGSPYPTDDLEWWKVTTTGKNWGINAPGYGPIFHESGNQKATMTVVKQVPGPFDWVEWVADREFRGNQTFNVDRLCAYFGFKVDD